MSAGVGGGGIFVPMGILLLRFGSKAATGLSQASIFGASIAGLLINGRRRHPLADRPLIDFDMALFLAPMEVAGATVGVLVQKVLPEWAVILLMAVILGYTAYRTFRKGFDTYRKEQARTLQVNSANQDAPQATNPAADVAAQSGAAGSDFESAPATGPSPAEEGDPSTRTTRAAWAAPDSQRDRAWWLAKDASTPWNKMGFLVLMWVVLVALFALRGGKGATSLVGLDECSGGWWALFAAALVWLSGFSLFMGRRAVRATQEKRDVGYPFVEGDIVWTFSSMLYYSRWTFVAGVIAGLIGIGGGMVLGPLMLELGSLPQVSTATTATLIVLTSSVAAGLLISAGLVPIDYAALFFGVAFCGAFIGKTVIDGIVKKYKLTAVLIFILAGIITFASVMVTVAGVVKYSDRDWEFEGLEGVC